MPRKQNEKDDHMPFTALVYVDHRLCLAGIGIDAGARTGLLAHVWLEKLHTGGTGYGFRVTRADDRRDFLK